MFNYIYDFFYPEEEIKVDPKILRQKYLVLKQIQDNKLKLRPINNNKKIINKKIYSLKNKLP